MFVKVFIAVMLMVIWVGTAGSGMKMDKGTSDSSAVTMGVMLDKKIVEYYLSHSNQLPAEDNGTVSLSALKVMGLNNYDDYRDKNKFLYVPESNGTFSLTVYSGDKFFVTKNSNKVLSEAVKEEY